MPVKNSPQFPRRRNRRVGRGRTAPAAGGTAADANVPSRLTVRKNVVATRRRRRSRSRRRRRRSPDMDQLSIVKLARSTVLPLTYVFVAALFVIAGYFLALNTQVSLTRRARRDKSRVSYFLFSFPF